MKIISTVLIALSAMVLTLPADAARIKDGRRVPEGFRYTSDNNTEWMTPQQLTAWIEANREKIGTI